MAEPLSRCGAVVNTGVGVYVAQVDLTSISGVLEWKWQSTGTGQAAATGTQTIPALPW